jgi:hypothetical protein
MVRARLITAGQSKGMIMCRTGGRRCPSSGGSSRSTGPPPDGKTRIAVVTNKRSYSVIGGESRVTWMPGEKVVSIEPIEPTDRHT